MEENNSMSIEEEIISWLHGRPDWQQEAVARNLTNRELTDLDFEELTTLSKTAGGQKNTKTRILPGLSGYDLQNQILHIVSISDVQGIENLRPRKPITFGQGNLVVVYGNNASGKTGYVRIIKKACGKADAAELRPNVFAEPPAKRCCKIEYKIHEVMATKEWMAGGPALPDLAGIDIFDSDSGRIYLSKESEVSYRPRSVAIFDDLVRTCVCVRQLLQKEKDALPSKLPTVPTEYANTPVARLFEKLKATHTESELAPILSWDEADQKKLNELEERLKADDPSKLAAAKRNQKAQVEGLLKKITGALSVLCPESCHKFIDLKIDAQKKRQIATEGATKELTSTSLDGVGTDTWRALWEAARRYSEEKAYPASAFPNTADGAKCVLCQQSLLTEAKQRLSEFEAYVKGELESVARTAERGYQVLVESLPAIQDDDTLRTACQASGLKEEDWIRQLSSFWKEVSIGKEQLMSALLYGDEGLKQDAYPWIEDLQNISLDLETQAKQHDADAQSFDRPRATQDKTELKAKQWTAQQGESIKAELQRLKAVAQYDKWIKGTDHTAISKKAGDIAEKVITTAYIDRFNCELDKLGAKRIKVELVKTRAERGRALHGIKLRGATAKDVSPLDILSEGEKKIVELAAFLADVMGRPSKAPFVFDDPISSLDLDFEEHTIDRLIELSLDRQVIVFTHRLSFLGILCDKSNPDMVYIRHEPWGAGEPGDVPLFAKKPENALKKLRDERLSQAKKTLEEHGSEAYYPLAKSICSDFRILVERIVELVLLGDVIQRHRRAVNTKGKIEQLCKIEKGDCKIIDDFMTKYSCYEHSQSAESPVDVPEPELIKADIENLLKWLEEYKSRPAEPSP
jgi:energy-coupling factor transporter ATP-binding protein EcfA2